MDTHIAQAFENDPFAGPSIGMNQEDHHMEGLMAKLPKLCGICRTLDRAINPRVDATCRECMEAGDCVNWADIDMLEEVVGFGGYPLALLQPTRYAGR